MIADANVKPRVTWGGWAVLMLGLACLALVPARAEDEPISPEPPVKTETDSAPPVSPAPLAGFCCPETTKDPHRPNEQAKIPLEHSGAEISLELDEPEYFLGENVLLHWRIRNAGEEPFTFSMGMDGRNSANRALRFKVEAFDVDGNPVPDPYPNPDSFGGLGNWVTLKSGEDFWSSLQLMRYREFTPETYTIKVYHDLGWEKDGASGFELRGSSDIPPEPRVAPIATTTIRFEMPNAEQARQVVEAMLALPEYGGSWGEKGEPFADFELLRYPVYLPIMKKLAEKGDTRGVDAIGAMAFPEATDALLELMKHDDDAIAGRVAGWLRRRMPYIHDRPPSRRSYLLKRSWSDDLKKSAMESAWDLLAGNDRQDIIRGARIAQPFGTKDDLPRLIDVMDRVLVKYKDLGIEQRAYLRPSTASGTLADAAQALLQRGAPPPESATTPGRAVAWLLALGLNENFRPDGWRESARALIGHEIPFIRDIALRNLPLPLDEATVVLVAEAIEDDFAPVQGAACDLAGKAKLKAFGPPLIAVLKRTQNDWVMRATFRAATECGVDNDRRLEICVRRMKPRDNEWTLLMLQLLLDGAIETNGYGGRNDGNWASILPDMKRAWLEFIDSHRQELREGKKFEVAAPPLSPEMFPPKFQLNRSGYDPWPESPAP